MEPAAERVPREKYPLWVKFTILGGASSRNKALVYFALTIAISLVALILWLGNERMYWLAIGVIGIALSVLYPLTIRWIDRHGTWDDLKR
jgi:hypothetical protein